MDRSAKVNDVLKKRTLSMTFCEISLTTNEYPTDKK